MKANLILSCLLAAGLASSARAQLFDDVAARNVLLGGIAGAVIGDNNHHQAAAGAAIGAAAGLLWTLATTPVDTPVVAALQPGQHGVTREIVGPPFERGGQLNA